MKNIKFNKIIIYEQIVKFHSEKARLAGCEDGGGRGRVRQARVAQGVLSAGFITISPFSDTYPLL